MVLVKDNKISHPPHVNMESIKVKHPQQYQQ